MSSSSHLTPVVAQRGQRSSPSGVMTARQNGIASSSSQVDMHRSTSSNIAATSTSASASKGRDGNTSSAIGKVNNHLPPGAPSGSRINLVTYRSVTIKALIDPGLQVSDVIRQLCANSHLGVQEPSALFALRDDQDEELITDSNMARKIKACRNFKLCSSPTIEAAEMVDKLTSTDEKSVKMATYTLQRLIRDKPFYDEFLRRGGLEELVSITMLLDGGNTLAYALTCIQNLIECREQGLILLGTDFIRKVVKILVHQERINVCRPATAILKTLIVTGEREKSVDSAAILSSNDNEEMSIKVNDEKGTLPGFDAAYAEIRNEPSFLTTLIHRLGSADTTLCMYSLNLINNLIRHVSDKYFEVFTSELESLGASRAVTGLMDSNRGEELISSILEYQMNVIRIAHRRLDTPVAPTDKRHVGALSYLWMQARINEEIEAGIDGQRNQRFKWRRLGFENENIAKDFLRTGWLGLECCEAFVKADPEQYNKVILEQINRPASRRCPWGKASLEVVEILSDHYDVQSGYSTCTRFQPCLLNFTKLHSLTLRFFLRMWTESGAGTSDFGRVSALVRSQVKESLREESSKSWFDIESDFLESDYRVVRDRQMRELEVEDDFTSRGSVRNLRGRLYRESYEFVRQQRIQCLLEGAWFRYPTNSSMINPAANLLSGTKPIATPNNINSDKPWRFYRLSPNRRYLHYCEAMERGSIRSGLDDLPERIDLNLVTDVFVPSSTLLDNAIVGNTDDANMITPSTHIKANGDISNSLTFSLLRSSETSVADLIALNASQFSEWTDGLGMLKNEGGLVSTRETAEYIQILTDIGVKIKLLDLTGEAIDIPTSLPPATVPVSTSFFFAEL